MSTGIPRFKRRSKREKIAWDAKHRIQSVKERIVVVRGWEKVVELDVIPW